MLGGWRVCSCRVWSGPSRGPPPLTIFSCIWIEFNNMAFHAQSYQQGGESGTHEGTRNLRLGWEKGRHRAGENFITSRVGLLIGTMTLCKARYMQTRETRQQRGWQTMLGVTEEPRASALFSGKGKMAEGQRGMFINVCRVNAWSEKPEPEMHKGRYSHTF